MFIALTITSILLVGCAKDETLATSGKGFINPLGTWQKADTRGSECTNSDVAFNETREFKTDWTTTNGVSTYNYSVDAVIYINDRPLNYTVSNNILKLQVEITRDCYFIYNKLM